MSINWNGANCSWKNNFSAFYFLPSLIFFSYNGATHIFYLSHFPSVIDACSQWKAKGDAQVFYSLSGSLTVVRDSYRVHCKGNKFLIFSLSVQFRILRDESINRSKKRLMLELFGSFGLLGHSQGSLGRKAIEKETHFFMFVCLLFFSVSVFLLSRLSHFSVFYINLCHF